MGLLRFVLPLKAVHIQANENSQKLLCSALPVEAGWDVTYCQVPAPLPAPYLSTQGMPSICPTSAPVHLLPFFHLLPLNFCIG